MLQIKSARRMDDYPYGVSDFANKENIIQNSPTCIFPKTERTYEGSSCTNFSIGGVSAIKTISTGANDRDISSIESDKENINHLSNNRCTSARPRPSFKLDLQKLETRASLDLKANSEKIRETKQRDLEEKVKSFNTNINCFKLNNLGFSKSLFLVNGLIHDLDEKINKIRLSKVKKII